MTDSVLNPTIPGNELMWYDISFYASNDNGCWQIINDSEVNAQIDLLPIGAGVSVGYILNLLCFNNFISTYEWSHTEFNKITEEILRFIHNIQIQLCLINFFIQVFMIFSYSSINTWVLRYCIMTHY